MSHTHKNIASQTIRIRICICPFTRSPSSTLK